MKAKFKLFIGQRWHGFPIGIMSLVLAATLLVGGVAAASVALLSGSATVTVSEAISVTQHIPTDGTVGGSDWTGMTWSVSAYPGETKTLTVKLTNSGSAGIPVYATITGVDPELTESILVWNGSGYESYGSSYSIVGGGVGYVQFKVTASTSAPVDDYTLTLCITR